MAWHGITRGFTDPLPSLVGPRTLGMRPSRLAMAFHSMASRGRGRHQLLVKDICSPHGAEMNEFCVASIVCICLSRKTYHANLVCCNYIGTQWPIWCSDLLKFQKTMLSLEDSRHETTDETGTTPRFKLIDPNHAWKRFNHEKKT